MRHGPHHAGFPAAFVASVLDDALAPASRRARGDGARPVAVHGIAGLQGSGKSTLARQVAAAGAAQGLRVAVLSLDDCYLGRRERQRLGRTVHPLLATRGPPGTHDVALAIDTLDALRAGGAVRLPRFDKATDRRVSPSRWPIVAGIDLVLFDGWFLKVPPQDDAALVPPINALERSEDPEGRWRTWCNTALARDYPPLWARIDRLLFLQGPGFEVVPRWRWQQEQALRAARPGLGMTRDDVARFVQGFERVSRHALATLPAIADRCVRLDEHRVPRGGC